jgi:hypothetical protein
LKAFIFTTFAKMAQRKYIFKDEYAKAGKIAIRNNALGRLLKLSKDQVLSMAEGGRLSEVQIGKLFKPEPTKKKVSKTDSKEA